LPESVAPALLPVRLSEISRTTRPARSTSSYPTPASKSMAPPTRSRQALFRSVWRHNDAGPERSHLDPAGHTDMRRGMQGLSALVQTTLARNPFSGHVFVSRGRRGDSARGATSASVSFDSSSIGQPWPQRVLIRSRQNVAILIRFVCSGVRKTTDIGEIAAEYKGGVWWARRDSNPGPPACEAGALTS
jgi:hypothetical protein